jgi:beta-mannosidase
MVPAAIRDRLLDGIPATVPGVVHTDLMAAGLLADPYIGVNERDQAWVGRQTWVYRRVFALAADAPQLTRRHVDLACDGLDTVAEVTLNGVLLGHSANQHRRNLFDTAGALAAGDNTLAIRFRPALEYAAEMAALVGARPHTEAHPFNLVRKMACNFGWDWGPALITAGVFKAIGLVSWRAARILDLSVLATLDADGRGRLRVCAQLTGELRFAALTVRVSGHGVRAELGGDAQQEWTEVVLPVSGVEPWWPHSLGGQPLYDVEVTLHNDVAVLDRVTRRTGFRTVELDTAPDPDGQGATFGFRVNGTDVFARGANWIPDDCFPSRVTPERYRERIQQAKDANIDLLRVWGGGLYEQDAFYDACDELGMMVWQDFALACAAYPEEEPFWSEFEAEARDNVVRLSAHPSLIVWNGCNENIWGRADWAFMTEGDAADQTWGAGYYYDLFPRVVAELDPSRPYWPGSPSSGRPDLHPNDPNFGCVHIWDVWNERDYLAYGEYSPRFVAEFGYQGPATYATWARTLAPEDRSATSDAMLLHQKAAGGNAKLNQCIRDHLPTPGETAADFDDWLFAMQVQQAEAVRYGIERWRSLRGRCRGSVVWQINDCWPVTSWAALDLGTNAAGQPVARRKPLWYALRSAYEDRTVTLQREGGAWRLALVNDGREPWPVWGSVELRRLTGEVVWSQPLDLAVPVRDRADLALDPGADGPGLAWAVTVDGAERYVKLLAPDVAQDFGAPGYAATVAVTPEGVAVTVEAETFLRTLCLFPDRVAEDAWADTCLVDLFPGEIHTFRVTGADGVAPADLAEFTAWRALRCVTNPLHHPTPRP